MTRLFSVRLSMVLAMLVLITAISWGAGHWHEARWVAAFAVLALAAAKIAIIFSQFMDVRHAPRGLKTFAYGWALVVCSILFSAYTFGAAAAPYVFTFME